MTNVRPGSAPGPVGGDRRPRALRVLVLAPSVVLLEDGTEVDQLDTEREWHELAQAVGDEPVRLELLRPASLSHLERALAAASAPWRRKPYAAIYVSCHGLPGLVLLDDGNGLGVEVSGEELGRALGEYGVGLVVLGACHSAEGAGGEREREEGDPPDDPQARVGSVARALLEAGVKAVVGAVGSPYDVMAAKFAAQLLGMLARGSGVGRAFESARRALPYSQRSTWTLYGQGGEVLERAEVEPGCFTLPPDPGGLPRCPRFLDRAHELVKVSLLLDQGQEPVVWLGGEGGLGKTALAAEAAWRNAWRFPGGVVWVAFDRSPPSLEAVLQAAERVGLKAEVEALDKAQSLTRLASTPRRAVLFVLDNLDTVLEAADRRDAQAVEVLRWLGGLRRPARALVTSRADPGLGAVQASPGVAPFPLEASDKLFWATAGGPRPGLDRRDEECRHVVTDICRRLGGLTLAVELVGAHARGIDPHTLLANLETELESARLRGVPERQRSLEAALSGSFSALKGRPQAGEVLAVLAAFPAGAGAAMLDAILGEGNWSQGIHALCSLSVARGVGAGEELCWYLLPPVRESALGRVEKAAAARARRKGMEHLAGLEAPDRRDAANAAAAVAWLGELGGPREQFEFVEGVGVRLYQRGYWTEAEVLLKSAHGLAKDTGDLKLLATSAHNLGALAQDRGQPQEAERLCRESLKTLEELGDRSGVAASLRQLGMLAQATGQPAEAERLYRESLRINKELGDRAGVAKSLGQLGILAQDRGQPQEAEGLYRESLRIAAELGDRSGVAKSLHNLGILAQDRGQLQEAERLYRESLKIAAELGDRSGVAKSLHQLGRLVQARGQPHEAERLYRESLRINEELGDRSAVASTLHQLGTLARDRGQFQEAERLCRESLKTFEELGDGSGVSENLQQLGILAQARGQPHEAERLVRESLEITEEAGDRLRVAATLHNLGALAQDRGQLQEAERLYRESLKAFEDLGDRSRVANSLGALGMLSLQSGDPGSAEEYFQQSLETSFSAESVRLALGAYLGLIKASLLQGDPPKARAYLDRATAYARSQGPEGERLWRDVVQECPKEL